jgi:two-component system cell cycle sensor histidine kinase/response regulator CckA
LEGKIDFLLTDVIMLKMKGPQLAARLSQARPEMKVLYVSGYTDGIMLDAVNEALEGGLAFLQKPCAHHALNREVRDILDSKRAKPLTNIETLP